MTKAERLLTSVQRGTYVHKPRNLTSGVSSYVCLRPLKNGDVKIATRKTIIRGVSSSVIRDMTLEDAMDIVKAEASLRQRMKAQL
jgi:hypothetical protein